METAAERFRTWRPLAERIAGWYCRRLPLHVLRDDLIAAAHLGLWQAIRRSPNDGVYHFGRTIRGAIQDELRRQDWSSRRARSLGVAPTMVFSDELLESVSVPPIVFEVMEQGERSLALEKAIRTLSTREQSVVRLVLEGVTMKAVGQRMGISEPRVSQIMSVVKRKLAAEVSNEPAPRVPVSEPTPLRAIVRNDGRNDALARSLRFARQIHRREDWL